MPQATADSWSRVAGACTKETAVRPFTTALEQYRIRRGHWLSNVNCGWCGAWRIPHEDDTLLVVSSDGVDPGGVDLDARGWEHVSVRVAVKERCPTWAEMCYVKDLFWANEECVIQFHPPGSNYVNRHHTTLYLWRLKDFTFPLPPEHLM